MTAPGRCRLLRHAPAPGAWNMAVDEMLLERAQDQADACLRYYGWSEPTLSLGYFQTYGDRREHPPSLPCTAVRRLTGGGAILHDAELTYSIVLPSAHPLAARRDELYQAVHGSLIEALGQLGIMARLCTATDKVHNAREPFLCFQRRSPGDVLIGHVKVCGSAQRRRNGAVLQHGSLLWRASSAAPELPGVGDLASSMVGGERKLSIPGALREPVQNGDIRPQRFDSVRTPPLPQRFTPRTLQELEEVADLWFGVLSRQLGFTWQKDELHEEELRRAETLVETRYSGDIWTKNRGRTAGPAG